MDVWIHDTTEKLIKNIENIFRICKEKKKAIEFMEYAVCLTFYVYNINFYIILTINYMLAKKIYIIVLFFSYFRPLNEMRYKH